MWVALFKEYGLKLGETIASDESQTVPVSSMSNWFLRKHGGKSGVEDSIIVAASLGNVDAVKKHLAAGTDVNTKDEIVGWTSLQFMLPIVVALKSMNC